MENPNQTIMRLLGVVLILLGIIQIGVSAAAFDMTSWTAGAWWAGVICLITAVFAIASNNRCSIVTGCALSIFSILVLAVGMIVDGVLYGVTKALDTCAAHGTLEVYGNTDYQAYARACAINHSQDCGCVNGADTDTCYQLNLKSLDNCGQVLTKLPPLYLASVLFMLAMTSVMLTYSVYTCRIACCSSGEDTDRLTAANQPSTGTTSNPAGPVPVIPATPVPPAKGASQV